MDGIATNSCQIKSECWLITSWVSLGLGKLALPRLPSADSARASTVGHHLLFHFDAPFRSCHRQVAMEDSVGPQAPPESQGLTDRQVDGLLLSSKKIRYRNRKACYPCNKRKIKCDRDEQPNGQPCSNCRKRPHPELCSYEDSNPRSSGGSTRSAAHNNQPATPNQHGFQPAGPPVQGQPMLSGIHATSNAYGADRFRQQEHDHAASYSPYYGDNSASYASTPYSANASASPFAGQGVVPQANYQTARAAPPAVFAQPPPSAAHIAYIPQQSTNLRDEINSLMPPQKHILPYVE